MSSAPQVRPGQQMRYRLRNALRAIKGPGRQGPGYHDLAMATQVSADSIRQFLDGKGLATTKRLRLASTLIPDLAAAEDSQLAELEARFGVNGVQAARVAALDLLLSDLDKEAAEAPGVLLATSQTPPAAGAGLRRVEGGKRAKVHRRDPLEEAASMTRDNMRGRVAKRGVRLEGFEPPTPSSGNWWSQNPASVNHREPLIAKFLKLGWHPQVLQGEASLAS